MAWNMLSTGANAAWQVIKAVVGGVLAAGNGIWNTVSRYVNWLFDKVGSLLDSRVFELLPASLQSAARGLYKTLRTLWESIRDFWNDFWQQLTSFIQNLLASIERFVNRIISFAIHEVITIVKSLKEVWDFVQRFIDNPEAVMRPIIDQLAGMLEAQVPGKAREVAQQKMNEALAGGAASASAGGMI